MTPEQLKKLGPSIPKELKETASLVITRSLTSTIAVAIFLLTTSINCKMMLLRTALQLGLLVASAPSVLAATSWGFSDATVSIQTKGAGVGVGLKETYVSMPLFSD
jgi:hypothetical protein